MRIKYEPEVFVIGRQVFGSVENILEHIEEEERTRILNTKELWDFLTANQLPYPKENQLTGTEGEKIVESATRACYLSYGKGRPTDEFFANILDSHHGSTLEHAVLTLAISGVSRSLSHELVRHRNFSVSQLSQRYVNQENLAIVMPPLIQTWPEFDQNQWIEMVEKEVEFYISTYNHAPMISGKGLNRKEAREAARSLLPNAVETIVFVTSNVRAWRFFCELRGNPHADREIQALAKKIFPILKSEFPNIMQDSEWGEGGVVTPNPKI